MGLQDTAADVQLPLIVSETQELYTVRLGVNSNERSSGTKSREFLGQFSDQQVIKDYCAPLN
jgi:hypothetical protein